MYSLQTPLSELKGIGSKLSANFALQNLHTVKDLLLCLPLRYIDRSQIVTISQLEQDVLVSFKAKLVSISGFYKNRRRIDTAVVADETGKVKLMWFNNSFVSKTLIVGTQYMVSGKLNNRGVLVQPTVEVLKEETLHTGRLVPVYSSTLDIQQGSLRRILKNTLTQLSLRTDTAIDHVATLSKENVPSIIESVSQLHFPDSQETIISARERLALEELLSLIQVSKKIQQHWKNLHTAKKIKTIGKIIVESIPFSLTNSQVRSIDEIIKDITKDTPMNRVLIGDVGSGKTVVAGCAIQQVLQNQCNAALIAPTKILAQQHAKTLEQLFPQLKIVLLTSGTAGKLKKELLKIEQPTVFIGTHSIINHLTVINPALIVYDEQHRFGVTHRSSVTSQETSPHVLTMSATPIPRSLMLTIFSHLKVSTIDELPAGRLTTKTWVVGEEKRQSAYEWIAKELLDKTTGEHKLCLFICPFIDPSNHEAFENIASANTLFETVQAEFKKITAINTGELRFQILHGRMKKEEQIKIISDLYEQKIDILVTTPIVEVGVDLPTASIVVIEASERFGLASLHQLRGRVGRAGQQGYCLLFTNSKATATKKRLAGFSQEPNGLKLAEMDLKNRGSGDIFGTQQSGFSNLRFADWTNFELIAQAQKIYELLPTNWEPFFTQKSSAENKTQPLAN